MRPLAFAKEISSVFRLAQVGGLERATCCLTLKLCLMGKKHCLGIKDLSAVGYKSWEKRSQALRSSSDYYCPEWSRNCKVSLMSAATSVRSSDVVAFAFTAAVSSISGFTCSEPCQSQGGELLLGFS